MTQDELQKLQESLEKKRVDILAQLQEIAGTSPAVKGDFEVKVPEYGTDETENANEVTDLDRNFALEQQLEVELRQIETTLAKIKAGTYGACSNCNKPIEARRLKAMPAIHVCVVCAKKQV